MRMNEIIEKKRDGLILSEAEIRFWIAGLSDKSIPDYQSSALLMAIVLQGMNGEETAILTDAMLHSGDILDLSKIKGKKVDKHSTGGVGDKTTLILSPIVAACGAYVAKMSGRGLGHTGGTIDKLESIPGFNTEISGQAFIDQVNAINLAVVGQTGNLVYADKVLYSLRDVTGTVNSLPLIASSIMSKKLAGGADCIFLDVKYGEGAFMKTTGDAKHLAEAMIMIGQKLGRKVNAMITNMNRPLGKAIGNALEVYEAVLCLQNKGPNDLEELCLVAAGHMLYQAALADSYEEGYQMALTALRSGKAYEKFLQWIKAQGGDISVFDHLEDFIKAEHIVELRSDKEGVLNEIHALNLGVASVHLGAGRKTKEDSIDPKAGILIAQDLGSRIKQGDLLAHIYSTMPIDEQVIRDIRACFVIEAEAKTQDPLIAMVI